MFAHESLPMGPFTRLEVIDADGSGLHTIWQSADFTIDERPDWIGSDEHDEHR